MNRKQSFYIFGLSLAVTTVAFFVSPLRGQVCISQFRLSNENEQIEAALDYYIASLSRRVEFQDPDKRKIRRFIDPKFTTKEDFKFRFPNCCSVTSVADSKGLRGDLVSWLTGEKIAFVNVVFDVGYLGDGAERLSVHHYDQIPISTCGTIRAEVFTRPIGSVAKHKFGSPTQGMSD